MDTQTAGYQNKLVGAVVQTDYTGGFGCLRRRLWPWQIAIYLPRTYLRVFVDQDMAKVCHYILIGQDWSIKDLWQ